MTDRFKVVITGAFRFPNHDAAAGRVLALGKALREFGCEVVFCGWEDGPRSQDLDTNGNARYQGFQYFSQAEFRRQRLNPFKRFWAYLHAGSNSLNWLAASKDSNIGAVIAYHGRSLFLLRLIWFCRKNNIRLFFDCTEWYGAGQLVGGRFGFDALDNAFRMKVVNPLIGRGLVISRYLHTYYTARDSHVLRLPPLVDKNDEKWPRFPTPVPSSSGLSLVYAGTPGKKDLLVNILEGIAKARRSGVSVSLSILGPDEEVIRRLLGGSSRVLDELVGFVHFKGRVAQAAVPTLLAKSDFSVLLRRVDRHSSAGFPTKVVESMAAGVPVICNKTSDLCEFIDDGREGILVPSPTSDDFADALGRAAALTREERFTMRSYAFSRGETALDYRRYVSDLGSFIGSKGS